MNKADEDLSTPERLFASFFVFPAIRSHLVARENNRHLATLPLVKKGPKGLTVHFMTVKKSKNRSVMQSS